MGTPPSPETRLHAPDREPSRLAAQKTVSRLQAGQCDLESSLAAPFGEVRVQFIQNAQGAFPITFRGE